MPTSGKLRLNCMPRSKKTDFLENLLDERISYQRPHESPNEERSSDYFYSQVKNSSSNVGK